MQWDEMFTMARIFGLSIFLLVTLINASSAADWQVYKSHQHGFTIEYPAGLFTTRNPATNGEGVTFSNPEQSLELSIYGIRNQDNLSMRDVRDILVDNYSDREITYERFTKKWMVLSGYEKIDGQDMIFYQRLAISKSGTLYSGFEFIWPEESRGKIDHLLKRMSRSLKPPRTN